MSIRKIVLLAAIASLSVIAVLQSVFDGKDTTKIVSLAKDEVVDSISVKRVDGSTVSFVKEGDAWFVGDKKYPADKNTVANMVSAIGEIKILDVVSRSGDLERYGLDDAATVTVTASKAGKALRVFSAGKNAVASGQSYALIDGSKDVSLVSGNLKDLFDRDVASFRDKTIWSVAKEGITRIEVESSGKDGKFIVAKAGESATWQMASPESAKALAVDAAKADAFATLFATMTAESFAPEETAVSEKPIATFTIQGTGKQYSLMLVSKAGEQYLCASSETPYLFYITSAVADKLLAPYASLMK